MTRTLVSTLLIALAVPAGAAATGAALFKVRCAPCHGPDGSAQTPAGKALKAADLRSPEVQKLTDAEIEKSLTEGKGKMPASKLRPDDMKAVIAFLRTLKKEQSPSTAQE
jgi:cytochrome c6